MARTISEIAAEIFQMQADAIDLRMTPDDIDTWDSLAHLRLISAIELEYKIRMSMQQIQSIECLGDFEDVVAS